MTNEEMDSKVLGMVRGGKTRAALIANEWRASFSAVGDGVSHNDINKSLQRLRKSGKISYGGGNWKVT